MGTLSLREMMVREMRLRCFETRSKNAYLKAVEGLAGYYKRSPDKISCDEVHDYLIHLLEAGTDLMTIQSLMGHASIKSTMIYLRLTRKIFESTPNPLDSPGISHLN